MEKGIIICRVILFFFYLPLQERRRCNIALIPVADHFPGLPLIANGMRTASGGGGWGGGILGKNEVEEEEERGEEAREDVAT